MLQITIASSHEIKTSGALQAILPKEARVGGPHTLFSCWHEDEISPDLYSKNRKPTL